MARSPISRVGGKFFLANKIIKHFPPHECYVEPFGGAMHILFRKEQSQMEIYNDIDSGLVNFFNMVRTQPDELLRKLDFSLYSRKVFLNALANINIGTDIERACNFYTVNRQCFGGKMKSWGITSSGCSGFFTYEERIRTAHERLKNVHIENMDFRQLILKYDSPCMLFYLGIPYKLDKSA